MESLVQRSASGIANGVYDALEAWWAWHTRLIEIMSSL